jgi:hypothetical protein
MSELWLSLGILTGSALPDAHLADYRWDTTPRLAWGAQGLAGSGAFAGGLRWLSTETTQEIGLAGVAPSEVRMSTLEAIGQARFASLWGTQLYGTASAGWLHLGYTPDQITFDPGGGSGPIAVTFDPVDELIVGGGLSLKRPLVPGWSLGLDVGHRVFSMETAHRNGSAIETGRESFGEWSAHLELAWLTQRR